PYRDEQTNQRPPPTVRSSCAVPEDQPDPSQDGNGACQVTKAPAPLGTHLPKCRMAMEKIEGRVERHSGMQDQAIGLLPGRDCNPAPFLGFDVTHRLRQFPAMA